jgi:hypothetical protein
LLSIFVQTVSRLARALCYHDLSAVNL